LADQKEIEAMQSGTEERKVDTRDWRRLKRTPQGSDENGVVRIYVRPFILFIDSSSHIYYASG